MILIGLNRLYTIAYTQYPYIIFMIWTNTLTSNIDNSYSELAWNQEQPLVKYYD